MAHAPHRLRDDAIVEAILELRFDSAEAIPEIVVGRLADRSEWRAFKRSRLPMSEFPEQIRLADPNLRIQPLIELSASDSTRTVKIGTNVISLHSVRKYPGWNSGFKDELNSIVQFLFEKIDGLRVRRIGLRYINGFTEKRHYILSPHNLNISVEVKGVRLDHHFNLNFLEFKENKLIVTTRIASPSFVQGLVPPDLTAYLDIDIYTEDSFESRNRDEVVRLIDAAHTEQRNAFFGLLPDEVVNRLEDRS